ncbi:MAG: tRNA (adenosine(37)-N6)-threonylcarbamoyltransferase complex ATPase subunit type 1 TsaE, partial [Pseudomonadota bacterium]|nr:tRNA (adenosine(37)-N6)-threonylcarbamoyltransferase complex ATPase subunit type 1 TsaE [Pseudomonadota bacterium]
MAKYDFQVNVCNETETLLLGRKIVDVIDFPIIITLVGDLGAGKTTLTRGMLRQLGYLGHVNSPTFSIVEMYEILSLQIAHFDMYRITDEQELEFFGFKEY